MDELDALLDTVRATLGTEGLDERTLERSPDSTIVPSTPPGEARDPEALLSLLLTGRSGDARVELRGTLGEGGMGIVRLGRQRSLDRAVAVKSLRPEHRDERAVQRLLREAWVTGKLDHPNVVPVYDIVADPDGAPLVVLKKIEGTTWGELISDGATVRERLGAEDLLEWNLGVAMQVCNAMSFAHSRGVLHRDLKPENVMIGAFGEVYVVDWGLAVTTIDDDENRLLPASEAKTLAGTPHYMAPEMLGGRSPTERTDVYLLGAVLYEVVTGQPPHRGDTMMQLVSAIARSEPELPDDAPSELARIIRRAMHRDPRERYGSMDELRLSIRAALRSRDADRIAERGRARLAELIEAVAVPEGGDEARDAATRQRFVECRATFRDALSLWPDHSASAHGLTSAVRTMVDFELGRGDPRAARALLDDLPAPDPELENRVDDAARQKSEEAGRLERIAEEHDVRRGGRIRFVVMSAVVAVWVITPIAVNTLAVTGTAEEPKGWDIIIVPTALLAIVGGLVWWGRASMMRTRINRTVGVAIVGAMALNFVGAAISGWTGQPAWEQIHEQLLMFAGIAAVVGVTVESSFWLVSAAYLIGYILVPAVGEQYVLYVLGAANLSTLWALWRWRRIAAEAEDVS